MIFFLMKVRRFFLLFFVFSVSFLGADEWLKSVKPIITRAELKVYKSLKTEEEKRKFKEYFWKSRDPDPETPINEYKEEYFKRVLYAKKHLGGINSDRGRVYIYLGKPMEIKKYKGYEKIVSCELWIYKREDPKSGLPPFMNLLFYKPRDMGDYKLFYPGVQTAYDLLTPSFINHAKSRREAFRLVKMDFPELAQASLSVIPMEGTPLFNIPNTSSGRIIAKVFSIPEERVNKSYLSLFGSSSGIVEVEYSLKEIFGKFYYSLNKKAGFEFFSYSISPDHIGFIKKGEDEFFAKIQITTRVENLKGDLLFEKNDRINLKVNTKRKEEIEKAGISFNGFVPIIPLKAVVKVSFFNKTSKEFLNKEAKINLKKTDICLGFKLLETSKGISPYQFDSLKIVPNPKMIFEKTDQVVGIILSKGKPEMLLKHIESNKEWKISNVERRSDFYVFRVNCSEYPEGGYIIIAKDGKNKYYSKKFAIISYKSIKPLVFEKDDKNFDVFKYIFYLGEEYLNNNEIDRALAYLNKIPKEFISENMLSVFGKAYYLSGNYKKVIELLGGIKSKSYSSIALLANAFLKLNNLKKAAFYFEQLRKYGDTVEINNKLGAIYFSLGERKKAKIYWERAKKLKNKEVR